MKREEVLAGELFDYAVAHQTFTNEEAMAALGINHLGAFNRVARRLRLLLGDDDRINLVCDPQGRSERWLYRLVGSPEDAGPWVANRLRDLQARLETQHAVSQSLVSATDGRTTEGRKARIYAKAFGRLIEDVKDLDGEDRLWS